MSCPDMIEHPFCIILDLSCLVDCLLVLEEIDNYLALVSVVPEDKISAQREVTYQLFPAYLISHVYFACPYPSCTLFCEYLCDSRVDLPEVFKHHVLPFLLSDFRWHLKSNCEKSLEGVGLFGVVEQFASQFRRRFKQMNAKLLENFESFGGCWIFEVGFDHWFILMMQEGLDLHALDPSFTDFPNKGGQALLKPLSLWFTQLDTFYLVEVQQLDRAYKFSVLLFHLLQSDCYLPQFLHQLMICYFSLGFHIELDHRLYLLLAFQSQQKPTETVLPTYLIYFSQHLLLHSIQDVSLKSSIAILKGLQIQIQPSLDYLILENPFFDESFRFFLRFELQKEPIIAFIELPNRIHNLRGSQILRHHLHINCLLYITEHDCPYLLIRFHLTYILIITK